MPFARLLSLPALTKVAYGHPSSCVGEGLGKTRSLAAAACALYQGWCAIPGLRGMAATRTVKAAVARELKRQLDEGDALAHDPELVADAVRYLYGRDGVRPSGGLPRAALVLPSASPVQQILDCPTDAVYRRVFSLTVDSFDLLLSTFKTTFEEAWALLYNHGVKVGARGRPRLLTHAMYLALTLVYLTCGANNKLLQMLCGTTAACTSRAIRAGLLALYAALAQLPEGMVAWPSKRKQRIMNRMWSEVADAPAGLRVLGVVDGTFCRCNEPIHRLERSLMYSGKASAPGVHMMVGVLPTGEVAWLQVDIPGHITDVTSSVALNNQLLDREVTSSRQVFVGDGGFRASRIISPLASNQRIPDTEDGRFALAVHDWILARRKSVEWVFSNMKHMSPHLRFLPPDRQLRTLIQVVSVHLYNYRLRTMTGTSTLRESFLREIADRAALLSGAWDWLFGRETDGSGHEVGAGREEEFLASFLTLMKV